MRMGNLRLGQTVFKHHILQDGERVSNFATIPLCHKHHHTKFGVHCGWPQKKLGVTELDLLSDAIKFIAFDEARHEKIWEQMVSRRWNEVVGNVE